MTTAMTIGLIACGDKSESKEEASASSETAIEAETEAEARSYLKVFRDFVKGLM